MSFCIKTLTYTKLNKIKGLVGLIYYGFSWVANILYKSDKQIIVSCNIRKDTVVSLTTYGERTKTVHITIDSILSQSIRPYKIILWLSETEYNSSNLPMELVWRMQKYNFFDVAFCEDLKPHKKYFESMKKYPNYNVVTADDDVFYPVNWFETLINLHLSNPTSICCTMAHKITLSDGIINEYNKWEKRTLCTGPSLFLCPVGIGGVLYPPNSLSKDVFNIEVIKATCLYADDLWLKTMSLINGTNVVKSNKYYSEFLCVKGSQLLSLSKLNVTKKKNDVQMKKIIKIYNDEIYKKLEL